MSTVKVRRNGDILYRFAHTPGRGVPGGVMSQHHDPEFTSRIARLTFIAPPAPFYSPPSPEFAYASDEAGLVQRITDSTGTHYCTASWPVDHDGDEDFEPRLREPTGFRWEPVLERPTMRVLTLEVTWSAGLSVVGLLAERCGGETPGEDATGLWLERQDGTQWPVRVVARPSVPQHILATHALAPYSDIRMGDMFLVVLSTTMPPQVGDSVWLSTTQRDTPRRDDLDATSALSEAVRTQLQQLAGEVRQQLDAGHMPNGNDLDRLARWAQQAARHGVTGTAPTTPWREWAAKILAAYPWVGEFKPEDSDEKYRDGVRYVLLCIECDGDSSIELHVEMQDIRVKWGFS